MDWCLAEIRPFLGNNAPPSWHLCDGSLLPISGHQDLYSLIGTSFGGDGVSNFALPDLRGRLPIGSGQGPGLTNRAYTHSGGKESVALDISQMPAHNHTFYVSTAPASSNSPVNALFADPSPNDFYATTQTPGSQPQVLNSDTVSMSGGSSAPQAHENRMPTMAVNYIIAIEGPYPPAPS